jgi:Type II CAAX prenyl endopeptidase Rce1-like
VRAWLDRTPPPLRPRGSFARAAVAGLAVGLVIVALDAAYAALAHPPAGPSIARWRGLLASTYGGVVEEVEMRLLFVTALARLAMLLTRRRALTPAIAWTAIVIAALAFGAGHLPAAAQLGPLGPLAVARVITLNAIGAMVFGWFFWRRGFEHAVVAHFAADLVLHVVVGG